MMHYAFSVEYHVINDNSFFFSSNTVTLILKFFSVFQIKKQQVEKQLQALTEDGQLFYHRGL